MGKYEIVIRKVRRLAKFYGKILIILLVIIFSWNCILNIPPRYPATLPPVPALNAFDDFLRANATMSHRLELSKAELDWDGGTVMPVSQEWIDNEKASYRKNSTIDNELDNIVSPMPTASLLRGNATALGHIHTGLGNKYVFPLKHQENIDQFFNRQSEQSRILGKCRKLLSINALHHYNNSDAFTASNALVDLLHFEAFYASQSNAFSLDDQGVKQIDWLGKRLSTSELRHIVNRLEKLHNARPSYSDYLERIRLLYVYQVTASQRNRDWFRWYSNRTRLAIESASIHPSPNNDRGLLVLWYAWTVPNALAPVLTDCYLKNCIRVARRPVSAHARYPKAPGDLANWAYFGWEEHEKDQLNWVMREFELDGVMLSLALQGYRKIHGCYPVDLKELVKEKWLTRLPVDPFTLTGTIRYFRQGKSFKLYSSGPDGYDNGGKPGGISVMRNEFRKQTKRKVVIIHLDSIGDVIYGLRYEGCMNSNFGRL